MWQREVWKRQVELAGIRKEPQDILSLWDDVGMWRLIATIVHRRALRAWHRLTLLHVVLSLGLLVLLAKILVPVFL